MREHGDVAYVLFDTGPPEYRYLYGVNYERQDGKWTEGTSGNGPGWSAVGPTPGLGTLTVWGEAPAGSDRARGTFGETPSEVPIEDGVYLLIWWDVPDTADLWSSRQLSFRINGDWVLSQNRP
jgi:hypothetical protein